MEDSKQEDRELDDIAAKIITIGARNLESLKESKNREAQNIFDSPQKYVDNEPKKIAQPIFFGTVQHDDEVSQENVEFIPTTKNSAFDITQEIIQEIKKPLYKTVVEAEFLSEEDLLLRKSSKTDTDVDIQDTQEIIERDQFNISVVSETSQKSAEKEFDRPKCSSTPTKPVHQKLPWKKRLYKFLILGVARKLEVGYPPGYPIPKLTKSYFHKKASQENKKAEPLVKMPAHRSSRHNVNANVNNNKSLESKFVRSTKGELLL